MPKTKIVSSQELRNVSVKENEERLLDTRLFCPRLHFEIAEYLIESERADAYYVREGLIERINQAINILPLGYSFILRCGYRSQAAQQRSYERIKSKITSENPDWTKEQILERLDECVSPVDIAPHCTGGAIDIFLCDLEGKHIDIDCGPSEFSEKTFTYSDAISQAAKDNREIMIRALSSSGLSNFPGEIWHWSYGEYDWAAYQKKPFAIYGPVLNHGLVKSN